jgi:hypothetical protein
MMVSSTDTPFAKDGCPPLEDLAAFLDGKLSEEERARIVAHLAECERCYEVFAGAARFQEDSAPKGRVFPFPFRKRKPADSEKPADRDRWRTAALAASALLVVGLGALSYYRTFVAQPGMVVADLIEPLQDQEAANQLYEFTRYRGNGEEDVLSWEEPSFMVGVFLVDLRLSLAAGDVKSSEDLLREIGNELNEVPLMEDEAKRYLAEATQLAQTPSVDLLRQIAATAPERERRLGDEDESVLSPEYLAFGKWTEAARLAAVTRSPDFFEDGANWRFLNWIIRKKVAEQKEAKERVSGKPAGPSVVPSEVILGAVQNLSGGFEASFSQILRFAQDDTVSREFPLTPEPVETDLEPAREREDEVLRLLYRVQALWKDDNLTEEDYAALAETLNQIIKQYDL